MFKKEGVRLRDRVKEEKMHQICMIQIQRKIQMHKTKVHQEQEKEVLARKTGKNIVNTSKRSRV